MRGLTSEASKRREVKFRAMRKEIRKLKDENDRVRACVAPKNRFARWLFSLLLDRNVGSSGEGGA